MDNKSSLFPFGAAFVGGSKEETHFNSRCKLYPDGGMELLVCDRPIFNPYGVELRGHERPAHKTDPEAEEEPKAEPEPSDRALRRARTNIADLARCNHFDYFVTLTLDQTQIDRYSYEAIVKKLNIWCDNAVRRKNLRYILIPEHHKDGAVHFHGLFSGSLNLSVSHKETKQGQPIYNIRDWGYGFSVAIPLIGEYMRVVNYIRKYITKSSRKVGGRYYLSGGKLQRPELLYSNNDYFDCGGYEITIPGVDTKFKKIENMEGSYERGDGESSGEPD